MRVNEIEIRPFQDQKPGTAGLRKKVAVIAQPHYLESFLQSVFDAMPELSGQKIVLGGDGRYYNDVAIQAAIRVALGNGVTHIVAPVNGFLSTPGASHLIRHTQAAGGFIFSASHNPAGPDGDFGIKFNLANGGQAPESLTDRIYELSRSLTAYREVDAAPVDLSAPGLYELNRHMRVEVVDGITPYADLMETLFDFPAIRTWLGAHRMVFDAMHAITGPYAREIFVNRLGAPESSIRNAMPLPDFGGGHPDPNLIYAADLAHEVMDSTADGPEFGAASDGDGDRNMILGRGVFVSPGDSLAVLAAHLPLCPSYRGGLKGVARSMPTSRALDVVASALDLPFYETPTGWKFFCNLLDAGRITLCGEESFGTGSDHVREKDGLWAVLAWLNILAATGKSVLEIMAAHWARFGRHYYQRHDYDGLSSEVAKVLMTNLTARLPSLIGQAIDGLVVTSADSFAYTDPIDNSHATNQGLRIVFGNKARVVVRLSGTGTEGATLRLYLEFWETDPAHQFQPPEAVLAPLARIAGMLTQLTELTGRTTPDVVT